MSFVHLHVHTQYSILDGLSNIKKLFARARELGMPALAITDHGNMYGVKEFFKYAYDKSNIDADGNLIVKPIIGCEIYVTRHYDHHLKDQEHRRYYHLILLAKNYEGYRNLMKICSIGHTEGKYYDKPRVMHEIVEKYHENLICCSACLAGEVPKDILSGDIAAAEEAIEWHKRVFGEDYYLEVMLHKTELTNLPSEAYNRVIEVYDGQKRVNEVIFDLAVKHGVKTVATNDVHFISREDGPVHDRLICLTTNQNVTEPDRLHYTQQEFLKSEEEMSLLFPEHHEALEATLEIAGKVENYKIDRGHVLPKFKIADDFLSRIDHYLELYCGVIEEGKYEIKKDKKGNEISRTYRGDDFCKSVAYLCELTYRGAAERYGAELNQEQKERIDFELKTIARMGFPDYFLIVQDYINACRAKGDLVGPGRGSAAGSVVAYCLHITNLDPIKYKLLFERFLNPDRISMPDIDVDFENLDYAHEYVEKTYGISHVSRVITFGTMAAKGAIKDVARISQLSLPESDRLSKMVPDRLSEKVEKEYPYNPKFDEIKSGFKVYEKEVEEDDPDAPGQKRMVRKQFQIGQEDTDVKINLANCYRLVPEFRNELENGSELTKEVLYYAQKLEGCIRQVGQHACATIIGPGDIGEFIPICLSKDKNGKDLWTSQYDGHFIEDVGMLKMDFLGLNTLSIIKETLKNIKLRRGIDIDIEKIPDDDPETYELYSRGDTTAVFQFESPGMRKWLRLLHPERFDDLIAMNALYRPGPMDYIPDFVDRKQGVKQIEYDLPEMEEYLNDTYGITVYQEQVMLLSQKLAGFTKGQADTLRKAMGKKQIDTLQSLKGKFMEGGRSNGLDEKKLDKIWKDWEKFAQYAFNKSHATCYAWVSYQTGWLKTHYTAEFLAANMSCNLNNMDEIVKLMDDCRHLRVSVLGPDINESSTTFTVNSHGAIRFGLAGVKGVGSNIIDTIISVRNSGGPFADIFDFIERMPAGLVNRKTIECLAYSGAFDSLPDIKRVQFFAYTDKEEQFIDTLVKYASKFQNDSMMQSANLFGAVEELKPVRPEVPPVTEYDDLEFLRKEKEYVGMFLSAHPLDKYRFEVNEFANSSIAEISVNEKNMQVDKSIQGKEFIVSGLITAVSSGTIQKDRSSYTKFTIEDYTGSYTFFVRGDDAEKYAGHLILNNALLLKYAVAFRFRKKNEETNIDEEIYGLKIKNMVKLSNVRETMIKSFHLAFSIDDSSEKFRGELMKILKRYKGKVPLYFDIFFHYEGEELFIPMYCKKQKVSVNADLLDSLSENRIKYKIEKELSKF